MNGIGKLQAMAGWDITPTMTWDAVALGAMLAISLACVKIFDVLRYRGYMSQVGCGWNDGPESSSAIAG